MTATKTNRNRLSQLIIAGAATSTAVAGAIHLVDKLETKYEPNRTFEVAYATSATSETTKMDVMMDGEPSERGFRGGGGAGSTRAFTFAYTDKIMEVGDAGPTKIERSFGDITADTTAMMRDEERVFESESAFEGITVVFTEKDGEIEAEITDGDAPDEERLTGHPMALMLDRLLPEDEVDAGDTWEIASDDFIAALSLNIQKQLIDAPQQPEGGGDRGGQGGRRGRGGAGGGRNGNMLAIGEWTVEATFTDETKEVDGVEYSLIKIAAEVEGEPPAREQRGRRDRAAGPMNAVASQEGSRFAGEFEGELLWSVSEARPVSFTLEGKYALDTETARETARGMLEMSRTVETTVEIEITVSAGTAEGK